MKLTEYYRNTVNKNDMFTGGWSPIYYGVFSKVINENNFKNVAEVGIGYGTHAKQILKNTDINKLHLIDPMCMYNNYEQDFFAMDIMKCEPEIPGNNFNEMYALIQEELSPWKEKINFVRKPSLEVGDEIIGPESLDCVFVDANHTYPEVLKDLFFWWRKVRSGGQMLGDDYYMDEVKKAVDEFAKIMNLPCDFLMKPGTDYKIFRFVKP